MQNKYYNGYMPNDFIDGIGISVSLWVSGCPHHCPGCHNKDMWNFNSGGLIPKNIKKQIIQAIADNGILRNFSVLGGEPLCDENISFVNDIIQTVRSKYPSIKIFLWTGYTVNELKNNKNFDIINQIMKNIDYLIDGRYEEEKRDVTLFLRGSFNQNIYNLKELSWEKI